MFRSSIALGITAAALATTPARAVERLVDGIAAQVSTRIVLVSEVLRAVGPQEAAMRSAGAPESEIAKLRASALETLIEARLIEGVVSQLELFVKDDEIDRTIENIAKENGLSMEQLYASVVFHGMTRAEYRRQIKQDLERRNVVQGIVGNDVEIEEADIRALYDERFATMPDQTRMVRVRQLLVSYGGPSKRSEEEACALVDESRALVAAGEDFETLAREISEVAPADGGDIGWLDVDQIAPWMSDAIEGLEPGGVSERIVLPFGCSILRLEDRRNLERITYERAKPKLHEELWNRKMEDAYREWMEELRGRTYIERRGYFADAAQFGEQTFPVEPPEDTPEPRIP